MSGSASTSSSTTRRSPNVSYWESDPTKPDALHFERADGQTNTEFDAGEANYFDITNKLAVNPTEQQVCYEENGDVELLHRARPASCASSSTIAPPQVVKVRHAFAKISPKHDYQPRNWDGQQMNLFGIWDVGLNRLTYNRQYGVTNTGIKRHAARFNLWKKSYQDDGKTPIPYNQRQLRTIPYYAESSLEPFPPELFDQGKKVISSVERRGQVRGGRRHGVHRRGQPVRSDADSAGHLRVVPQPGADRRRSRRLQGGPQARARRQGQRGARRRRQSDPARASGRSRAARPSSGSTSSRTRARSATGRRCSTSRPARPSPARPTSTAPRSTPTRRARATSSLLILGKLSRPRTSSPAPTSRTG